MQTSTVQNLFRSRLLKVVLLVSTTVGLQLNAAFSQALRDPAPVRHVYSAIHDHLEPGGDLMVVANIDGVLEQAVATLGEWIALLPEMPVFQERPLSEVVADIDGFLRAQGGYAVQGFGMSMVPRADGLTSMRSFLARDPDARMLPLWRAMVGDAPGAMRVHHYLPRDAVYVYSCNTSAEALWQLIRTAVADVGGAPASEALEARLAAFSFMTGTTLDALIASLASEGSLSLHLSETEVVPLDLPGSAPLAFPQPSLLWVVEVNEPLLLDTVKRLVGTTLQMELTEVAVEDGRLYPLPLPLPLPVPVELTLAAHDRYLLLGTTQAVVADAIQAAVQGNGLVATAEFQALFPALGANNGIRYSARRFAEALLDVQAQMVSATDNTAEDNPFVAHLTQWAQTAGGTFSASVVYNQAAGVQVSGISDASAHQLMGAMLIAPAAVLTATAFPAFTQARAQAQAAACHSQMQVITVAAQQAAIAENIPQGGEIPLERIQAYLPEGRMPVCPDGGSYRFTLTQGQHPVVRCSKHGH